MPHQDFNLKYCFFNYPIVDTLQAALLYFFDTLLHSADECLKRNYHKTTLNSVVGVVQKTYDSPQTSRHEH